MKNIIEKLIEFKDLSKEEAMYAMNEIMEGRANPAQISAFLVSLRMKGETTEEIVGLASVMREKAQRVNFVGDSIDIVGTGGDCSNTFNISTCCAFVVASANLPVAKHGNRSASSNCGSADVLESLGTNINLTKEQAEICLNETGICFMFAPNFHLSMKYVGPTRKELGIRTIFNILGPLANPAHSPYMLLGVYDKKLLEPFANVLKGLGIKGAMVVYSEDGLDEISISAPTYVCELRDNEIKSYTISPLDFSMNISPIEAIKGGVSSVNAEIIINILKGEKGAKRDIILLNFGAALYIANKANSIKEGIEIAREAIDSGKALKKLNEYKDASNKWRNL